MASSSACVRAEDARLSVLVAPRVGLGSRFDLRRNVANWPVTIDLAGNIGWVPRRLRISLHEDDASEPQNGRFRSLAMRWASLAWV